MSVKSMMVRKIKAIDKERQKILWMFEQSRM